MAPAPAPTTTPPPEDNKFPWFPKGVERVVGGEVTDPSHKYPWLVGIYIVESDDTLNYTCGGAIINSLYVVTSAQCLEGVSKPKKVKVRVADFDHNSEEDDIPGVTDTVAVKQYFVHEDFTNELLGNDIALLQLKKPLDLISHDEIKPVCLPVDGDEDAEGEEVVLVGRGTTDADEPLNFEGTPQEVTLSIFDSDCNGYPAEVGLTVTDTMLCAGLEAGGKDSCFRDEGSPLTVVSDDGRHILVGLVSFGPADCGAEDTAGFYTRITQFIDWIFDTIDGNGSFCG